MKKVLTEDAEIKVGQLIAGGLALLVLFAVIYAIVSIDYQNYTTKPLNATLSLISINNSSAKLNLVTKSPRSMTNPRKLIVLVRGVSLYFGLINAKNTPTVWFGWSNISDILDRSGWFFMVNITDPNGSKIQAGSTIESGATISVQEINYDGVALSSRPVTDWSNFYILILYNGYSGFSLARFP